MKQNILFFVLAILTGIYSMNYIAKGNKIIYYKVVLVMIVNIFVGFLIAKG